MAFNQEAFLGGYGDMASGQGNAYGSISRLSPPPGVAPTERRATPLTPITCFQAHTAEHITGDAYRIGGKKTNMVSLVVQLCGWQLSPTQREVMMSVTDGTGSITVQLFGNAFTEELEEWAQTPTELRCNFLRLYGHLRTWNDAACVIAFSAAFEPNTLSAQLHHYLSVAHAHLYYRHGPLTDPDAPAPAVSPPRGLNGANPGRRSPVDHGGVPYNADRRAPPHPNAAAPDRPQQMRAMLLAHGNQMHAHQLQQEAAAVGFSEREFVATLNHMLHNGIVEECDGCISL